jgi:chromosomal replication initiator protein
MQKQIIISSDKPPKDMQNLAERIRSRFEAGLTVHIQKPDLETRIAILRSKALEERINVLPEVFSYIATRITSNIRELEGALMRLKLKSNLDRVAVITLEYAAVVLKEIINSAKTKHINIELIQQIVAEYYKLSAEDLRGRKRTQDITLPRHIAMYFSRELTETSLPKIGEAFGGRDHSTVLHAIERIQELRIRNTALNDQLQELLRQIQV